MTSHKEIVKQFLDNKAVDFNAIGKMVSDLGPSIIQGDDPWENFCWTMRTFIHLYRRPPFPGPFLEDATKLKEATRDLQK